MRTNVVLNDDLLQEAMAFTRARTKKGVIEEALQAFVEMKHAEQKRQSYEERLRLLDARLGGRRLRTSALDILRADRERR